METTNSLLNANNKSNNLSNRTKIDWKKTSLWLPFLLLSLFMVIVPLVWIIVITLIPAQGYSVKDNWDIINGTIWLKIGKSVLLAVISTIICLLISFPFCYFLCQAKSKRVKKLVFTLITMPMWLGSMIILVSLKMFFDKVNGAINSTYGDVYTVIGIVYFYLPFMMMPLYNTLEQLPQNLINASRDLGRSSIYTFFKVVVPFTKHALLSGISLVLLPAMSVVAIPQFLNNNPDNSLIGDIIMSQGQQASDSDIALARTCVLSVVVSLVMFVVYGIIVATPKLWNAMMKRKTRKEMANE